MLRCLTPSPKVLGSTSTTSAVYRSAGPYPSPLLNVSGFTCESLWVSASAKSLMKHYLYNVSIKASRLSPSSQVNTSPSNTHSAWIIYIQQTLLSKEFYNHSCTHIHRCVESTTQGDSQLLRGSWGEVPRSGTPRHSHARRSRGAN